MVRGLNIFREYFGDYTDSYIIIGGTACDQQFESLGLTFRATTDIDIVLVIEALDSPFVKKFWEFIQKDSRYIRFIKIKMWFDPALCCFSCGSLHRAIL